MFRVVGALFCLTSVGFPVLLFAQSAPAPATPSPRQDSVFKAGSEEVLLDVTAHDKKGQLVTNLTSEDLAVFDNGVQRKISSFRLVQGSQMLIAGPQSGGPASEVQRQQLDPLRQVRLITLIFSRLDAVNDRQVAKNAALDLIKTELPQNVYVAVWVLDHNLKAIQEFSND
ncbi:MAG: hypothetical protein JO061_00905, partial [Acidobacteriaceae bacterium]|nr:hypothetical protein [Acidobacteriaceae bacterium]